MNQGINESKTNFLLFLNSGDILEENSLSFFLEELSKFQNCYGKLPEIIFFKWRYLIIKDFFTFII